ncbi:Maltose transport MAL31 [Hyphodiscus hymeniophilus]|uniref:Maltose transport MAL31 n=1 Tax=Hyphodiscus hymeniophilus TaxID=353542 RepID=A0A9P7AVX2_9HELO|nr:Maltose transport MAL31 [Hyphodiscus hymeniophilus]
MALGAEEVRGATDKNDTLHTEDVAYRQMANKFGMIEEAREATRKEHHMTLWHGLKLYPTAAFFSFILSACIIMEGFQLNLMQGFFAFPSFQKKYGTHQPDGSYQLTAAWQAGLTNGAATGEILGLFLNGVVSERYGYRKTVLSCLFAVSCFILLPFFAKNIVMLEAGEVLLGIPWGVFQTLTTVYASEVCPVSLRAYLTTYVNLCWVIGTLLGQGVLRAFLDRNDQWGYRIPFALQWIWPVPLAIGVFFAPESPWWLVRKDRIEDAKKALLRLTSRNDPDFNADETVAMMVYTNEIEKESNTGTTYWDCFKGVSLRRTEITCVVFAIQNLSGAAFMNYSTYFFVQAGLSTTNAFNLAMIQYALGAVGTICSWFLMLYFGRRTIYIAGLSLQFVFMMIIGFLSLAASSDSGASWGIGGMLLAYTFFYDLAVGSVCYSLVAEIPANRLRTKTVVLARNTYNIIGLANNVIIPYMINPSAWNWKGKAGFFWAGLCFVCALWSYYRLPEPKGRTFAELDLLFERKVSARNFKTTIIDAFHDETFARVDIDQPRTEKPPTLTELN